MLSKTRTKVRGVSSEFVKFKTKRSVAETKCENLCKSKGYERNQWVSPVKISRNPGCQAPCCHLFIFIFCFIINIYILIWVRTEQCQSPQSLSAINILYLLVIERDNFPNDLSFSLCKSIRGKIRESGWQSLLSLLCDPVAANKPSDRQFVFASNLSITGEC